MTEMRAKPGLTFEARQNNVIESRTASSSFNTLMVGNEADERRGRIHDGQQQHTNTRTYTPASDTGHALCRGWPWAAESRTDTAPVTGAMVQDVKTIEIP